MVLRCVNVSLIKARGNRSQYQMRSQLRPTALLWVMICFLHLSSFRENFVVASRITPALILRNSPWRGIITKEFGDIIAPPPLVWILTLRNELKN
ncbi:hypothetical protein TNCT_460841 [Trichonephila clavata]|uniref:Uncharacterized protein n=1 Tax=Trichonephila clavata TaxID=2740835 RepID=A0A8X6HX69_TRICU|nr:hypothetical protein TNCT_460841 [Trichonephila clavata]